MTSSPAVLLVRKANRGTQQSDAVRAAGHRHDQAAGRNGEAVETALDFLYQRRHALHL